MYIIIDVMSICQGENKLLRENKCTMFTTKEIKPSGWLKRQLEIQADGLPGNLYKIWPDIKDSAWIGGKRGDWERVPYWLDGFIPLAYLLDDDEKKKVAKRYVDGIIEKQQSDGWICLCEEEDKRQYDIWPMFLICKVLVLYYECTEDERIEPVIYKALKKLRNHIQNITIFGWASARWYECLIPIYWLYERVNEEWLLELAVSLYSEGINYKTILSMPYCRVPKNEWNYETHAVNIAMALKSEPLISRVIDNIDDSYARKMLEILDKYHGTAVGHFTGDECLSGSSPVQGTELCGIVEAMYSYEILFSVTGDYYWLDRLERIAYNAFPATISDDMWTHQYDQMVNQIACVKFKDKVIFRTNNSESDLFGLEPNFGCCTANMGQGWPKFALSTYYRSKDGIISATLAPSNLHTSVRGVNVDISLETEYPFRNNLKYTIKTPSSVEFTFEIRIPQKTVSVKMNGKSIPFNKSLKIHKVWSGEETIKIELEFKTEFLARDDGLNVLERGPLVYALPIEGKWKMHEYIKDDVERKFPYCDYEIFPISKWNYGFADKETTVYENPVSDKPFSKTNPPIEISADVSEINWKFKDGYDLVCDDKPVSTKALSGVNTLKFRPYGCTILRMTELPFCKTTEEKKPCGEVLYTE